LLICGAGRDRGEMLLHEFDRGELRTELETFDIPDAEGIVAVVADALRYRESLAHLCPVAPEYRVHERRLAHSRLADDGEVEPPVLGFRLCAGVDEVLRVGLRALARG